MKIFKADSYFIGIILLAAGIVIAFFPQFLSGLFYIAGAVIIIYNIILLIFGFTRGVSEFSLISSAIGIIFGLAVTAFPKLIAFGLPVIIGICFIVLGIKGILTTIERKRSCKSWILQAVAEAVLIICGILFIFNPFGVTKTFIRLAGIILIIGGIAIIALSCLKNKKSPSSSVIDVEDFSVSDDDSKRIQ